MEESRGAQGQYNRRGTGQIQRQAGIKSVRSHCSAACCDIMKGICKDWISCPFVFLP